MLLKQADAHRVHVVDFGEYLSALDDVLAPTPRQFRVLRSRPRQLNLRADTCYKHSSGNG